MVKNNNKFERRFLVKPECVNNKRAQALNHFYIIRTYLSFDPEDGIEKIIYPDNTKKYTKDVKNSKHTIWEGDKLKIKNFEYLDLYHDRITDSLCKTRYIISLGNNLVAEMDTYKDFEHVSVRVAFKTKEEMDKFTPPDWFSDELTWSEAYNDITLVKLLMSD